MMRHGVIGTYTARSPVPIAADARQQSSGAERDGDGCADGRPASPRGRNCVAAVRAPDPRAVVSSPSCASCRLLLRVRGRYTAWSRCSGRPEQRRTSLRPQRVGRLIRAGTRAGSRRHEQPADDGDDRDRDDRRPPGSCCRCRRRCCRRPAASRSPLRPARPGRRSRRRSPTIVAVVTRAPRRPAGGEAERAQHAEIAAPSAARDDAARGSATRPPGTRGTAPARAAARSSWARLITSGGGYGNDSFITANGWRSSSSAIAAVTVDAVGEPDERRARTRRARRAATSG